MDGSTYRRRTLLAVAFVMLCAILWSCHRIADFAAHPPALQRTTGPFALVAGSRRDGRLYSVGVGLQQ